MLFMLLQHYFLMEDRVKNMIRSYLKECIRSSFLQLTNRSGYAYAFYECAELLLKSDCGSISLTEYSRIFKEEVKAYESRLKF